MRKSTFVAFSGALLICFALAFAQQSAAQSNKPKGGITPVTAEFRDSSGIPPDRIKSDGLGIYTDNTQKVSAIIESGAHRADFNLWLGNTKGVRQLSLDFADCVDPIGCSPPFAQGLVFRNTGMRTLRADLPGMAVGATAVPARLHVGFDATDPADGQLKHWFLRFDPLDMETDCQGSTVAISRTASDTWVIEADALDTACLLSLDSGGAGNPVVVRGRFVMPLQVTVRLK